MFSKSKRTLGLILAGLTVATAFAACAPSEETDPTEAPSSETQPEVQSYSVDDILGDAELAMGDEDNVKLRVWAPQAAVDVFQQECDKFSDAMKEQGKTVEIEVVVQSEYDAATLLKTDPESAADVIGFASDQGLDMFKGGYVSPVRRQFVQPVTESNLEGAIDTVMFKGAEDTEEMLYAYPSTGDNGYVLYYDKRYLSEDDVKTLEGIVKVAEEEDKMFAMDMGNGFYGCMIPFTGGGTLSVSDDYLTQVLNYDYEKIEPVAMAFADVLSTSKNFISEDVNKSLPSGFKNGTYIAGVCGTWISNDVKEALGDNLGVVKLPTINVEGEDTQIVSMFGYKNMAVNSQTKYPVTAQSLAYYLTSEEAQLERYEQIGWGPSTISLVESDTIQSDPIMSAVYEQQKYSVPQKDILMIWWSATGSFTGYCVDSTKDHSAEEMKKQYDAMVEVIEAG